MCDSVSAFSSRIDSSGCPSPLGAGGPLGTCFISDHLCSSANAFLPARFSLQCCLAAAGSSLDWKEFRFGTTHFEFRMGSPFSGIRLLRWKRIMLVLLMSSLLLRCQFFKTDMKTIQVLISARILPQHNFLPLSELTHGDVCCGVQTRKQVIYFIYRYVRRRSFAFYCKWKYIKLYLTEKAWNKAVIEIFFSFF